MIWSSTASVILFLLGALLGIYLPGVVLYGVKIWRSSPSWQSAAWNLTKKGLIALFGFFVLSAVISHLTIALLGPTPTAASAILGFLVLGVVVGLIGGTGIAGRAIWRSRHRPNPAQNPTVLAVEKGDSR